MIVVDCAWYRMCSESVRSVGYRVLVWGNRIKFHAIPLILIALLSTTTASGAEDLSADSLPIQFDRYLKHVDKIGSAETLCSPEELKLFGDAVVVSSGGLKQLDLESMALVALEM